MEHPSSLCVAIDVCRTASGRALWLTSSSRSPGCCRAAGLAADALITKAQLADLLTHLPEGQEIDGQAAALGYRRPSRSTTAMLFVCATLFLANPTQTENWDPCVLRPRPRCRAEVVWEELSDGGTYSGFTLAELAEFIERSV